MLGLGLGLNKHKLIGQIPFKSDAIQYTKEPDVDGILVDKIGISTRTPVYGAYLDSGTISTGLLSESYTYYDIATLAELSGTTSATGEIVVTTGIKGITIDSHYFPCEEGVGAYIGATDGEYYEITTPVWDEKGNVFSYADENGYTVAVATKHFWDSALTVSVTDGAILVKEDGVNACIGYSTDDEIYVTSDDYIYVTSDDFIYVT